MSGETDLSELLKTLSVKIADDVYVFATIPDGSTPPDLTPRMLFQEAEGTTLILRKTDADAHGITYEFPCRMITLNVHSSLEAVGFIAHIATELAKHGMGVNPVAGFFHDHLFIPEGREQDALRVLEQIADASAEDR